MACRTLSLDRAWLAVGLLRLKARYGFVLPVLVEMCSPGFLLACSCGIEGVGTGRSHIRSSVPAWTLASAVWGDAVPSVTTIWLTYWCRSGSVVCFQAGFRLSTIFLFAMYWVIAYGPSDS